MSNPTQKNPQKMLTFLDKLHHKYEILSKLTQKQSQLFNNEVVLLLVDQNQNVDQETYRQVIKNIGLDAFVLDILGKCVNRSPFTNQYQLKKNMNAIADNLQKQVKELNKKMKIVQRKQQQLNQRELGLKNKLKQYAIQLEKQYINKLINKQNQIKKNINGLLSNVRAKEKILQDRRQEILGKLVEINNREKNLVQKQKELSKKSFNTEISGMPEVVANNQGNGNFANNRISGNNGMKQLREITKKYEECKVELDKLKKKYKTTEMAYSKVKNDQANTMKDNQRLQQQIFQIKKELQEQRAKNLQLQKQKNIQNREKPKQKQKQILDDKIQIVNLNKNKKIQKKAEEANNKYQLFDMLQMLEISEIEIEDGFIDKHNQKQNCKLSANRDLSKDESVIQIKKIPNISVKGAIKKTNQSAVQQVKGISKKIYKDYNKTSSDEEQVSESQQDDDVPRTFGLKPSQSHTYQDQLSQQNSQLQIPKFLTTDNTNPTSILTQITSILNTTNNNQTPTLTLIQNNHLLNFTKLPSFHHNKHNLIQYLDTLLTLIQQSNPHYYQLIQHLSRTQFTQFFQLCYLNYQSILQITQATTLILSRIMMLTSVDIKYREQFINAIKVRVKAINTHTVQDEQFLQGNINCLLSMIHA